MVLVRGAIARTIVANLPRPHLESHIKKYLEEFKDIGLGIDLFEVTNNFLEVKRNRVCVAREEITPGVMGIASPIFDSNKYPVAALCVTLGLNSLSSDDLSIIIDDIKGRSEKISKQMGRF